MYEFLFSALGGLSLQTELLEACEWDQDLADDILASLSLAVKMSESSDDVGRNIDFLLAEKATENQILITKKIFNHEAKTTFNELKKSGGIH